MLQKNIGEKKHVLYNQKVLSVLNPSVCIYWAYKSLEFSSEKSYSITVRDETQEIVLVQPRTFSYSSKPVKLELHIRTFVSVGMNVFWHLSVSSAKAMFDATVEYDYVLFFAGYSEESQRLFNCDCSKSQSNQIIHAQKKKKMFWKAFEHARKNASP